MPNRPLAFASDASFDLVVASLVLHYLRDWIGPLRELRRVLVADETRRTGGVSEGVLTALVDAGFAGRVARVTSEDSFIPLGDAAAAVLLSEQAIEAAARDLLR